MIFIKNGWTRFVLYNGFQSTDVTRWCDVGLVNSLASVLPGGPCHI